MTKSRYKRKIFKQRLCGLGIIMICALIILVASRGVNIEDRDCAAVLLLLPLGVYTLLTRRVVIM